MYKPPYWLTASVVMVFIPTDGHGYRGNGSQLSISSITERNKLSARGASLHRLSSVTLCETARAECERCSLKPERTAAILQATSICVADTFKITIYHHYPKVSELKSKEQKLHS